MVQHGFPGWRCKPLLTSVVEAYHLFACLGRAGMHACCSRLCHYVRLEWLQ